MNKPVNFIEAVIKAGTWFLFFEPLCFTFLPFLVYTVLSYCFSDLFLGMYNLWYSKFWSLNLVELAFGTDVTCSLYKFEVEGRYGVPYFGHVPDNILGFNLVSFIVCLFCILRFV